MNKKKRVSTLLKHCNPVNEPPYPHMLVNSEQYDFINNWTEFNIFLTDFKNVFSNNNSPVEYLTMCIHIC